MVFRFLYHLLFQKAKCRAAMEDDEGAPLDDDEGIPLKLWFLELGKDGGGTALIPVQELSPYPEELDELGESVTIESDVTSLSEFGDSIPDVYKAEIIIKKWFKQCLE